MISVWINSTGPAKIRDTYDKCVSPLINDATE